MEGRKPRASPTHGYSEGTTSLDIRLLGRLEVVHADRSLPLGGLRQRAVLALLLLHANEVVSSDRLIDEVWGGDAPASAATTLRGYLSHLRKALSGAPIDIESRKPGYIAVVDPWTVDVCRFDHLVEEGYAALRDGRAGVAAERLRAALALWGGPALADFVYEPFAAQAITRLEEQRLVAIERRIEAELALGHGSELIAELESLVAQYPLREVYRGQLMRALHRAGRRSDALAVYQQGRRLLADELGLDPAPELQRLEQAILLQDVGLEEPAASRAAGNLPGSLTSFVGRDREMRHIAQMLQRHRLVTITGTGGSGKTRLASEAARRLDPTPSDGVWLVELASATSADDLAVLTAVTLGIPLTPDRKPLETLRATLAGSAAVLILDNCEHVRNDASVLVHDLLQRCPHLRILTTTREPLGVPSEVRWRIPSLDVPPHRDACSVARALDYDAVRLFVDRAQTAVPEFELTAENVQIVSRICDRLDGLPLAIELASARLETLTAEQILTGLDDRFRLLESDTAVVVPRHRTLRAAVDFSYDLLSPRERALFERCSVFAGDFDLSLVEEICAGGDLPRSDVLGVLSSLVGKSLIQRLARSSATAQYRLLETLRTYAAERASAARELDDVRRRHARVFQRLAQEASDAAYGPDVVAALDGFERHHDDHRAALAWLLRHDSADAAIDYADALWVFWNSRFHISEGRRWLEECLERPGSSAERRRAALADLADLAFWEDDFAAAAVAAEEASEAVSSATRGRALVTRAEVSLEQADHDAAERLGNEALWVAERGQLPVVQIEALRVLASVAADRGDLAVAEQRAERCLALSEEIGYLDRVATAVGTLGSLAHARGDLDGAAAHFRQCLDQFRALGNSWSVARALNKLGSVAVARGEAVAAHDFAREALETFTDLRSVEGVVDSLLVMSDAARQQGDLEQARLLSESALERSRERALAAQLAASLRSVGTVALRGGDARAAERLLEEAVALHERSPGRDAAEAHLMLGLARARLGAGDAEEPCRRALELFNDLGDARGRVRALLGLAEAALAFEQPLAAVRYLSAARSTGAIPAVRAVVHEGAEYLDLVRRARLSLGEEQFESAWNPKVIEPTPSGARSSSGPVLNDPLP